MSQPKTEEKPPDSFLTEVQREGRASENQNLESKDLDEAIGEVSEILVKSEAEKYRNNDESSWPEAPIAYYCHDCAQVVEGRIQNGRRSRVFCQACRSPKISKGRKEALIRFYHLEEDGSKKVSESKKTDRAPKKAEKS